MLILGLNSLRAVDGIVYRFTLTASTSKHQQDQGAIVAIVEKDLLY